jgi:hypothetical protein
MMWPVDVLGAAPVAATRFCALTFESVLAMRFRVFALDLRHLMS